MDHEVKIVTVDATNVDEYGFFCYKSKPKAEGYRRKLGWLRQRFAEGMRIKIVYEGKRSIGFIEYIPGEYTWRAVDAAGYMVIHCLWVVGSGKNKGYGSRLLNECVEDARSTKMHGVAMVTSAHTWLASPHLFLKHGFEAVDKAPLRFELLVKRFGVEPWPAFPQDWDERIARYGSGMTVIRSDQCPYIDNAVKAALEAATARGIQTRVVELQDAQEARRSAPSAYGVYSIVYDGRVLTYHSCSNKDLLREMTQQAS
jgi:L-amino acid N-acyltransferase YncA